MINPVALKNPISESNLSCNQIASEIKLERPLDAFPSIKKLGIEALENQRSSLKDREESFFENKQIAAFGALSLTTFLAATLSKGNLFTLLFSSSIGFGLCASSLALHSYVTDYHSENP